MSYVDGYVLPVPKANLEAYKEVANKMGAIWIEHGALAYKECIADDLAPEGIDANFLDASGAESGDTVIFAYVVFKSREHRDEVNRKAMEDPRAKESCDKDTTIFNANKMIMGGFETFIDL